MMNSMIKENGVTFKQLEKNIYAWVCQIGREFTKEFLERYDRMLLEDRDKKTVSYTHLDVYKRQVKFRYRSDSRIKVCISILRPSSFLVMFLQLSPSSFSRTAYHSGI